MSLRFNREQRKKLADIAGNLSLLFFGVIIAPLIGQVDSINFIVVVSCGLLAIGFFIQSMIVLKGVKDEFKS